MQCAILSSLNLHAYRPENAKEEKKKKKIENQKSEVSIFPKVSIACTEISYFQSHSFCATYSVGNL